MLVSGPAHGDLTLCADGSYVYTPAASYNGADSFTYKANDGSADSNVATVSITVNPVNDAPTAAGDSASTNEGAALNVASPGVLANDTDPDGDHLAAVLVSGPAHGTLSLDANGAYAYTPAAGYSGPDSFTYRANDGSADSGAVTVAITVNAVVGPPPPPPDNTPGPPPPPVEGKTVNAFAVSGTVLVKLPAGAARHAKDRWTRAAAAGFVPIDQIGRQVPVGSTLDTTRGTVRLLTATNSAGKQQDGRFAGGLFSLAQGRKNPLTTLAMTGSALDSCPRLANAAAAARRRRTLFSNVHGRFRTRGRNSTATVRGTEYRVTDTCSGTLTKVTRGAVMVRDFTLRRTRLVKAGHSYFAHAPASKKKP